MSSGSEREEGELSPPEDHLADQDVHLFCKDELLALISQLVECLHIS